MHSALTHISLQMKFCLSKSLGERVLVANGNMEKRMSGRRSGAG